MSYELYVSLLNLEKYRIVLYLLMGSYRNNVVAM